MPHGNQTVRLAIPTSDPGFDQATGRHTINLLSSLRDIDDVSLTIVGPGSDKLTVQRGSAGFYRIFNLLGSEVKETTISGMTISNGLTPDDGGGLRVVGR